MSGVASLKVSTLPPEGEYVPLQHRNRSHPLNEEGHDRSIPKLSGYSSREC
jgi:hypothetical protein